MTSIRTRLLLMLLMGLAAVLTAGGTAVYWIARADLTRQFDAGLSARAHTLAALVKLEPDHLIFESGDAPPATLQETYFELRTQNGDVLKRSSNLGEASLPMRALAEHETVVEDTELPGPVKGRVIQLAFRPRIDADDWVGRDPNQADAEILVVAAAMDRRPVDRALAALLAALIVVGIAIALAAAIMVAVGVRWGLAPLGRLSNRLAHVTGATISERLDETRAPRELLPIHAELNRMLDRVQQTIERERSFSSAAAHELRTPLAELRTTAEVALRWPDQQRAMTALKQTLSIGHEMERLVESLLRISRADATSGAAADRVTATSIVQNCMERASDRIRDKELTVKVSLGEQDALVAPREALEIIVNNLVENALNYTPPRGSISISSGSNGTPSLVVENGPVALSHDDLQRLFEPFWRLDGARTDRTHNGLGLTVVQRVAGSCGLCVQAELTTDRLRMRVFRHGRLDHE